MLDIECFTYLNALLESRMVADFDFGHKSRAVAYKRNVRYYFLHTVYRWILSTGMCSIFHILTPFLY